MKLENLFEKRNENPIIKVEYLRLGFGFMYKNSEYGVEQEEKFFLDIYMNSNRSENYKKYFKFGAGKN